MRRRDFFKQTSIFGCGAIFGAGCFKHASFVKSKKELSLSNVTQTCNSLYYLPHIEISLNYHCNLNCAGCCHCAPIAPAYFMPIDIFEKDLEQMQKITKGKIEEIVLLGGEPLLNRQIEKYIELTRKYFKKPRLIVFTNGLLLNDMPNSFWQTCNKNNTIVHHSIYPLYEKYPNLKKSYENALKYNVKLTSGVSRYEFHSMQLDKNRKNSRNYKECKNKIRCAVLDNGILYPCQIIASVNTILNKYFKNYAIEINKDDYLEIYNIKSLKEILEFYNKTKDFCKYCNYKEHGNKKAWSISKCDATEWFRIYN